MRASLACLPEQVDYLSQRLLDCSVDEFPVIRNRVQPYNASLLANLWTDFRNPKLPDEARFHAGMALAAYAAESPDWNDADADYLTRQLLVSNPDDQRKLRSYLHPLRQRLLPPLEKIYTDPTLGQAAAAAWVDYAPEDAARLARLASESSPGQYLLLYAALTRDGSLRGPAVKTLVGLVPQQPTQQFDEKQRVELGRRRARAAITLIRLAEPDAALAALRVSDDPEALSQFVVMAREYGLSPADLLECLDRAREESVRIGLLLALGGFPLSDVPETQRRPVTEKLLDWHRTDPSSGIHGATAWVLRQWGHDDLPCEALAPPSPPYERGKQREWFVLQIGACHLTFVIHPAGTYMIGSPDTEQLRVADENRHRVSSEAGLRHPGSRDNGR